MDGQKWFLHQIKCTDGTYSKGIVVADTYDAAKQGFHAYFGAYGYGHDANTTFVQCMISNEAGLLEQETWVNPATPEEEEFDPMGGVTYTAGDGE